MTACSSLKEDSSRLPVLEEPSQPVRLEAPLELGEQQVCSDPTEVSHRNRAEELGVRRRSGRLEPYFAYGGAGLIDWNQDNHLDLIYGYPGEDLILYLQTEEGLEQHILPLKGGALQWGAPWGSPVLLVANDWITLFFPEEVEMPYFLWFEEMLGTYVDLQLVDWDNDSDLDLYVTLKSEQQEGYNQDRLFLNTNHRFSFADLELEGQESGEVFLWWSGSEKQGVVSLGLEEISWLWDGEARSLDISGLGAAVGSANDDLEADILSFGEEGASLYVQEDGELTETFTYSETAVRGAAWVDVNNDGEEELIIATVEDEILTSEARPQIISRASGAWQEADFIDAPGAWSSVVTDDWNQDGVQDILITSLYDLPLLLLSEGCGENHWLRIEAPIGARVTLKVGGKEATRWSSNESGIAATKESFVWFGLGSEQLVEQLEITLPNGEQYHYGSFEADRVLYWRP